MSFVVPPIYTIGGGPIPPPRVWPACTTCPSPGSYDKVLPWPNATPPPTRDFLRASWWSVPIPGLPFVPGLPWSGGSREHPERLLTGLDYKYDRVRWPEMVAAHRRCSYTHWLRWWGNARVDGGNSEEQFVDDCLRLKALGMPYICVSLWTKDADPHDQSAAANILRFQSIVQKLLAAGAVDELIPGFEFDLGNIPGPPTIDFFKWVGQQAHRAGVGCWAHFSPQRTAWFTDGDPRGRFGFWDDLGTDVDGLNYQAVPTLFNEPVDGSSRWDIGLLQARLVDTLDQFGRQGNVHKLRAAEFSAAVSFTQDRPTDAEHNALGYLACCTAAPRGAVVWGSGDGLPYPGED